MRIAKPRQAIRGRPRGACIACRMRHLKCDDCRPCIRCQRARLECSLDPLLDLKYAPSNVKGSALLHGFARKVATWNDSRGLYWPTILCAAQHNDMLQNALEYFVTINAIPVDELLSRGPPVAAMKLYCQSLSKPSDDLVILLQATLLILAIEGLLDNDENRQRILCAAFALVYWNKSTILARHLRDDGVYTSLYALLTRAVLTTANKADIDKSHWEVAISLFLRMSAERDASPGLILCIEHINILYDFGRNEFESLAVGYRFGSWRSRFLEYKKKACGSDWELPWLTSAETCLDQSWHYWKWRRYGNESDKQIVVDLAMKDLAKYDALRVGKEPQACIGPTMLFSRPYVEIMADLLRIAWLLRDETVLPRIRELICYYGRGIPFIDVIVNYTRELARVPHGQMTLLEKELFGPVSIECLEPRHSYRSLHRLVTNLPKKEARPRV